MSDQEKEDKLAAAKKKYEELKKKQKKKSKKSKGDTEAQETGTEAEAELESVSKETEKGDDVAENSELKVETESKELKVEDNEQTENDGSVEAEDEVEPEDVKKPGSKEDNEVAKESGIKGESEFKKENEEPELKEEEPSKKEHLDSRQTNTPPETQHNLPKDLKISTNPSTSLQSSQPSTANIYSPEIPFPEIKRDVPLRTSSHDRSSYPEAAKTEVAQLKQKIASLEAQINKISLENTRLKSVEDGDELALLPLSPGDNKSRPLPKTRKTSFVEVDLYGEASKISDIRKQMEQWKGWQLDMRGWRSHGIGPVIDV